MSKRLNRKALLILAAMAVVGGGAAVVGLRAWLAVRPREAIAPATAPAPPPPAAPGVAHAAAAPPAPAIFLDVVRSVYPDFPATQPLGIPLDLQQASHLVLHDPIYLGGVGRPEMWITHAGAPPIEQALKDAADDKKDLDSHLVRERVVFVHWLPKDDGGWAPWVICRTPGGQTLSSLARGTEKLPGGHVYHWERAISWNEKIVAPTDGGVAVITLRPALSVQYHELPAYDAAGRPVAPMEPRVLLEGHGALAWIPWETPAAGGRGALRYVEAPSDDAAATAPTDPWVELSPQKGWPQKILHLAPLLDGTVLLMTLGPGGSVGVQFNTLERAEVKESDIAPLVEQLSDADARIRAAAYDKLSQYGSGIWPILEKMMDDQGPDAQARLKQLLRQRSTPTLNGMALLGNKALKSAAILSDGGAVFYAEAGVSIPNIDNPDAGPDYRVPAWISIRPGHAIELLGPVMTEDLIAGRSKLQVSGNDWIISSDARGPRRFVGNGFVPLLRKSEQAFSEFIGVDRRGRWLFRQPREVTPATAPATGPAAPAAGLAADSTATLVLDPSLPDPTPRLPIWVFNTADVVGWTKAGWPVAKKVSAYALHESGWAGVDDGEKIYTRADEVPPPGAALPGAALPGAALPGAAPPATAPTTAPASSPASAPAFAPTSAPSTAPVDAPQALPAATAPREQPIWIDPDGNQYFGGLTNLRIMTPAGKFKAGWELPPIAVGNGPPWLVGDGQGRLFLFNQAGRVVRLRRATAGPQPFVLEKIFTHRVPSVQNPTRVWLDPAGRIVMAWDNQLALMFPQGYIPQAIADMIPAEQLDDQSDP